MAAIDEFKLQSDGEGIFLVYSHGLMTAVLGDRPNVAEICVSVVQAAMKSGVITEADLSSLADGLTKMMDSIKDESKASMKNRMFGGTSERLSSMKEGETTDGKESPGLKLVSQLQLDNEGQAIFAAFSILCFSALLKGKSEVAASTVTMMRMAMAVGLVSTADSTAVLDRGKMLSDLYYNHRR